MMFEARLTCVKVISISIYMCKPAEWYRTIKSIHGTHMSRYY